MAVATNLQGQGRKGAFDTVAASQTDSVLVAAVAGKKVRVVATALAYGGTPSSVTFNSKPAGAGTAITPAYTGAASSMLTLPDMVRSGWFESNVGEGLTVTTGVGSSTGINVIYELVGA